MAGKVELVSSPCIALHERLALCYKKKRRNVTDAALRCAYLTLRYIHSVNRPLQFTYTPLLLTFSSLSRFPSPPLFITFCLLSSSPPLSFLSSSPSRLASPSLPPSLPPSLHSLPLSFPPARLTPHLDCAVFRPREK